VRVRPGSPYPLGARWDGLGTHFAIHSRHATSVELCLFDEAGDERAVERVSLRERTSWVWHAHLPDVHPGALYGYRIDGPWAPEKAQRFNPAKLLLDPYARAICGRLDWNDALCGHRTGSGGGNERNLRDSAAFVPKGVVIDDSFPWHDDAPPRTPWSRTVVYECHVKGMTQLHPDVPEDLRGSYLGFASEPVVEHLKSLGVTAVELLPVQHRATERHLAEQGRSNYWGYNTLGFFAPDARFARGDRGEQVVEFKTMVKTLHRAGLEVILDVVYNHTPEGNHLGPSLHFRGIDNDTYYHLDPSDPTRYQDFSGCGNTLDCRSPRGLQLLMDSLRYWVDEMHVDGFRFDLAPALARSNGKIDDLAAFFEIMRQDPVLAETKLIAEPWDLGADGYRLGGFPDGFAEWNDGYRDTVRRFWRGDAAQAGDFASRVSGSAEVFQHSDRSPFSSLNYVTAHDGFTLADLVSYEHKHNQANGEDGADGTDDNWSANWGVEGETGSESIQRRRDQVARNLLATLALSQGVPMLAHGDEMRRTQHGNNNAYCHDDRTTWVSWDLDARARDMLAFTRQVFALRAEHPVLRRRHFFRGANPGSAPAAKDVVWLRPDGGEMGSEDWNASKTRAFGMLLPGEASVELDERGRAVAGDTLLLAFNPSGRAARFVLPPVAEPTAWEQTLCTADRRRRRLRRGAVRVVAHSLSVFTLREPR
jgi:glycogen operon protein